MFSKLITTKNINVGAPWSHTFPYISSFIVEIQEYVYYFPLLVYKPGVLGHELYISFHKSAHNNITFTFVFINVEAIFSQRIWLLIGCLES